jgi:FKBP-type peptidyl-prolyl cis-trans isomerase FkpA
MKTVSSVLATLVLFLLSCNNGNERSVITRKPGMNEMAELNQLLVQKDRERIQNYIERKNLQMTESPSGLWYCIRKVGSGEFFKDNDKIQMDFECSLLDGTQCYSSKSAGPKEIILGRSELEAGLNEGLRLLKPGGEASFILPPFLAFGLLGDNNKIPSRAVVIYEIRVINK